MTAVGLLDAVGTGTGRIRPKIMVLTLVLQAPLLACKENVLFHQQPAQRLRYQKIVCCKPIHCRGQDNRQDATVNLLSY